MHAAFLKFGYMLNKEPTKESLVDCYSFVRVLEAWLGLASYVFKNVFFVGFSVPKCVVEKISFHDLRHAREGI